MEIEKESTENTRRTLTDDPQYFGAYLNMARHNVYLLINHLTETFQYFNFCKLTDDEDIAKFENIDSKKRHFLFQIFDKSNTIPDEERVKIYNYLIKRHHLPFLKVFNTQNLPNSEGDEGLLDFDRLHNFIVKSFTKLDELRNAFTHYLAIDQNGCKVDSIAKVRMLDFGSDIKTLFKYATQYSYIRNKETQAQDNYEHLKNYRLFEEFTDDTVLNDQGLYFFINLFLTREHATKFLKRFKGFKDERIPPFKATIQSFTSYAIKLPDERLGNENPIHSLLMEVLTELNKCPKELYSHLTNEDQAVFDPLLGEQEKLNMVFNSTNYEQISDEDIESIIKDLSVLKRHNDRFPYFALRFLEDAQCFKHIRFQITLGKLMVKRYPKEIIGIDQDRRVLKTINAFGKLSDFVDKENEVLNILKQENEGVVFEQYAPHYNLNNNKIAFYIFDEPSETEKIKYPIPLENKLTKKELQNNPSGFISIHDLPKLVLLELLTNNAEQTIINFVHKTNAKLFDLPELDKIKELAEYIPDSINKRIAKDKELKDKAGRIKYLSKKMEDDFLSKNRLTAKTILTAEKNQKYLKKDIEIFSQIKYKYLLHERREELKKHLPKGLDINMFPSHVLDYLMEINERDKKKQIHFKIKEILSNTKLLKKSIEKESIKEEAEKKIKLGEIATYIASDILNMIIDKELKQKITTPYYNKLQNKIAYFSQSKEEIVKLCKELRLFDKSVGHVFLKEELINRAGGLIDFYKAYLDEKIQWIDNTLFVKGETGGYVIPNKKVPYTISKVSNDINNFDFKVWLDRKSIMPVELPNSLFDVSLTGSLMGKLKKDNLPFEKGDKFTILLAKFLKNDVQPYYAYKRSYHINREKDTKVEFYVDSNTSKELYEKYGGRVADNEKVIRFVQTKDRILKLVCDKLLSLDKNIGMQDSFTLSEIYPKSIHNPLERASVFKHKIVRKGNDALCYIVAKDTDKQIQEVEAYLNIIDEVEKEKYEGQKWYRWKIKDYGRFKRFVKDRRLPDLVEYFENNEIPFDLLEYQIKEYDKYRSKIFDLTFYLEKTIADTDFYGIWSIEETQRPKDFDEVQFDVYLVWLKNKEIDHDPSLIEQCRNKFSHSQFPQYNKINSIPKITKDQMDDFEKNESTKGYKNSANMSLPEQLYNLYKLEVDKIITQIKSISSI